MSQYLRDLVTSFHEGKPKGITSVCSAHPIVLRAALKFAKKTQKPLLIEATCNQVNHLGGYTGMKPADFAHLVHEIASEENCPSDLYILGGDHLGPNPWRNLPAHQAMDEAQSMIAAYVEAGFTKIHLDASMGCADEPLALDDATAADRAATLAQTAEFAAKNSNFEPPVYIIGTEVPPPGGADHALDHVTPTAKEAAQKTLDVHRETFTTKRQAKAFTRAIGLVVQPGVEFGNHNVIKYDREAAQDLVSLLSEGDQFIFEAHSTDYQGTIPLSKLVKDGFSILKVGPELTFVLREAFYGLDLIASDLLPDYPTRHLKETFEKSMLHAPQDWERHYAGTAEQQYFLRHYSYSDRIRYYWNRPAVLAASETLLNALAGLKIPAPLLRQHLPDFVHFADQALDPQEILMSAVSKVLATYHAACHPT